MGDQRFVRALAATALVAILPVMGAAQATESLDGSTAASSALYYETALGPLSRPITTSSPAAQRFFDQGVQMLYAFTPALAVLSFQEAQRLDPQCAMCFWAEAWARGPYLNGGMSANAAPLAYAAIQEALQLAPQAATEVERALIEAMGTRYVESHDPATRSALDAQYADVMAAVYEAFPADLDVGTLYAEALMLLEPRRGIWDIEREEIQTIHRVLEQVLERDLTHPGACHLYVHATESTVRPEKAEICTDYLGSAIPGASHINHMPSHTYNRVGRWGDAVRANIEAWHSDQLAEWGEGFAIYPSHNLHMLLFAASMDGQGAIAIQAAKDYAKLDGPGGEFYHALTLLRFGRFEEVLELSRPPEQPIFKGLWDFARGYAHLRVGAADSAAIYLSRVEEAAETTPTDVNFRRHTAASLLGITGGILRAEILQGEDRTDEAIAALERAVELEDALTYDEPEPLVFAARHWLGAILLEAGRATEAEQVYRAELEMHPHNGWSLFGLEQALRSQDRTSDADAAGASFVEAWARSDTLLRASRF